MTGVGGLHAVNGKTANGVGDKGEFFFGYRGHLASSFFLN
jgi:hypothetical protein